MKLEDFTVLRIAICDDEEQQCSIIENFIENYKRTSLVPIETEIFYTGTDLIRFCRQEHGFDLVFLDIELGKNNGIDVATIIRKELDDYLCKIVFTTSKNGYEMQLFDVQPLNFIKKPIEYTRLKGCLDLTIKLLDKENVFFNYKKGHEIIKIPIKDILYFESEKKKIKIITQSGEDSFYASLESIKRNLPNTFISPHGSFFVNFNKIRSIKTNSLIMQNGAEIPVSQRNLKNIRAMLIDFERTKNNVIL